MPSFAGLTGESKELGCDLFGRNLFYYICSMEYEQLVQDIFKRFPSVQKEGFKPGAYKPGLEGMIGFDEVLGRPSGLFRSIHVAGTNGKGSVANMLAAALTAAGYKTGLYTSPHLVDFRERARINGEMIPREYVQEFLEKWKPYFEAENLSFFEITTGMAFRWFADSHVDIAVIEAGLGGRLDSTNLLVPELSVITSIGLDHCALLGNTLEEIAFEKAGIMKPGVPCVIGESNPATDPVFDAFARNLAMTCPPKTPFWCSNPAKRQLEHGNGGFGAQTGQNGNLDTEMAVLVLKWGRLADFIGAGDAVKGGRNYAAGVTGTFTARVKAGNVHMLKRFRVTGQTHRGRRARLHAKDKGVVGVVAVHLAVYLWECASEAHGNVFRKQFVER